MKIDPALVIEAEKKLLSALMIKGGEAIPEVAAALEIDDFARQEHRLIYKALRHLSEENVSLDALIVERELTKAGDLEKVTRQYLYGLLPLEYTSLRSMEYAKIIKASATYRKLGEVGTFLKAVADDEGLPLDQLYGEVETRISSIVDKQFRNGITPAAELFVDVFQSFTQKTKQGLEMGFPCLDLLTGGLKKSDMIILAARPSMGKTALAMNIAANVAKKNSVLVFSPEMNKQQLGERWFSTDSGVKASRIQHRELRDQDYDALLSSVDRLGSLKLFVDDTMGITLPEIKMKSRRVKREHGLDLIVIDYLQLMQSSKRYKGDRVQEVSELSRGIKGLARDLDVPVLALSQLSRGVEYRADKRPMLSDLRESGSIEQDADIVMFIYRDDYYDRESEKQGLAEVIVAKNRNGATGAVGLQFDKARLKFTEPTIPG